MFGGEDEYNEKPVYYSQVNPDGSRIGRTVTKLPQMVHLLMVTILKP